MNVRALRLLRFDSIAGLTVGTAVLVLCPPLSALYGLPEQVVGWMGFANLIYGSYSGVLCTMLALKRSVSSTAVVLLASANIAWAPLCGAVLLLHWALLTPIGVSVLLLEAIFVAALGLLELRLVLPLARANDAKRC